MMGISFTKDIQDKNLVPKSRLWTYIFYTLSKYDWWIWI